MQLTRLHVIVIFALVVTGGFAWYAQRAKPHTPAVSKSAATVPAPVAPVMKPPSETPSPQQRQQIARKIADLGERYKSLKAERGPVDTVLNPLQRAKKELAAGRINQASVAADEALDALADFKPASSSTAEEYRVSRGDTLWTIARDHSPVHAGAGWVGLWKANKKVISNFDRIEVGWTLTVPQEARLYATRYWKPRAATARLPGEVDLAELPLPERGEVDLAQLPVLLDAEEVEVVQLPVPEDSVEHEFVVSAFRPPVVPFWLLQSR